MDKLASLVGKTFGRLTVIEEVEPKIVNKTKYRMYLCECSCHNHTQKIINQSNLRNGDTKSCGCLKIETAINKLNKINKSVNYPNIPDKLTEQQHNILVGHLLGDAHLKKYAMGASLSFVRQLKDLNYLIYSKEQFDNLYDPDRIGIVTGSIFDKRTNKFYDRCRFETSSKKILDEYRQKWYNNDIKIVPKNIELNSEIIAIWFCDDGCARVRGGLEVSFATHGFIEEDVDFLINQLKLYYNVIYINKENGGISKKGAVKYGIVIRGGAALKIMRDLEKNIPKCMNRKITWNDEKLKRYESESYKPNKNGTEIRWL